VSPRKKAAPAFAEPELSADARAILTYARDHDGETFTRTEVAAVAPGAAWDAFAPYPRTVADLDPIRELVRAGLVELLDEQPTKTIHRGGRRTYKRWKLTGVEVPLTLAQLLEALLESGAGPDGHADVERYRAEILRRFGQ
jgi:hypothetical protein